MIALNNSALLIIDVQDAIDHYGIGERSNPDLENKLAETLEYWRNRDLLIVHIRHSSKFIDSPYHKDSDHYSFKTCVAPKGDELIITKSENSAFMGTQLDCYLRARQISQLVICGVLINNSVDATIRTAANLGYKVLLPNDLTAAYPLRLLDGSELPANNVHLVFASNLADDYCVITSSEAIIKNL